jgi:hypothetical protein
MTQNLWAKDSELANTRIRDIMKKYPNQNAQRNKLKELIGVSKRQATRQNRIVPLTSVFNVSLLNSPVECTDYMRQYHKGECRPHSKGAKVIDFDDWLQKTGGHVDVAMVPNKEWLVGKCGKPNTLWPKMCGDKHKSGGTKRALVRFDKPVIYDEVHCNSILDNPKIKYVPKLGVTFH